MVPPTCAIVQHALQPWLTTWCDVDASGRALLEFFQPRLQALREQDKWQWLPEPFPTHIQEPPKAKTGSTHGTVHIYGWPERGDISPIPFHAENEYNHIQSRDTSDVCRCADGREPSHGHQTILIVHRSTVLCFASSEEPADLPERPVNLHHAHECSLGRQPGEFWWRRWQQFSESGRSCCETCDCSLLRRVTGSGQQRSRSYRSGRVPYLLPPSS